MSSPTRSSTGRLRKNVEDALLLGVATVLAVGAILQFGPLGLAAGSVVLSVTAAFVVRREVGVHDPAAVETTDDRIAATDGGRVED